MGRLLAFVGIPACAAIVAYAVVYIVVLWFGGEPPTVGALLSALIFGGLSLVVVLISLNAWLQDRRGSKRMGLWLVIPVLLVGGAIAGGVLATKLGLERLETLEYVDRRYCETLLGDVAESEIDACVPIAHDCRRENADSEPEATLPPGFPAGVEVRRAEDVSVIMCIHERL